MTENNIWTIDDKKEEAFLRKKTKLFAFAKNGDATVDGTTLTKKELAKLIQDMRRIMKLANGIGLSANQIGLPYRMFIAQVAGSQGENKFYAVFNPELEKESAEKVSMEEGCLSVIGTYGEVSRSYQVTVKGLDKHGKPVKIKAWGMLARVFQHEIDHLNGMLFIDRAKKVFRSADLERSAAE